MKKIKKEIKEVRQGFELKEFVTSCSTCMGKEGLLNELSKPTTAPEK
ncbi:MAG: hypothetical protein PHQ47_02745 [Candidatus Portnoybacteria bacterium]|nr:hypothetical protein [Candidatus Portnoybacteria bacterium]